MEKEAALPPQPDFAREKIHEDFEYRPPAPSRPQVPDLQPVSAPAKAKEAQPKKTTPPEVDFSRYLAVLFRRKRLVFVAFVATVFLYFLNSLGRQDLYSAETKLLVQTNKSNPVSQLDPGYFYFIDYQTKINTMLTTIKSREILKRVCDSLQLNSSPAALAGAITVERPQNTNLISLSVVFPSAKLAADIANCLARTFIAFNNEIGRKDVTDALSYIVQQLGKTEVELKAQEEKLRVYQESNKLVELSSASTLQMEKLSQIEMDLQKTLVDMVDNDERMERLKGMLAKEQVYIEQSFSFDNTLETQLIQLNMELAKALSEVGPQHRRVLFLKENINQIKELIKKNQASSQKLSTTKSLNQTRLALVQEYNNRQIDKYSLAVKKKAYERVIDELNTSISQIPTKYLELHRLQRDKENIEKIFELLQNKYQEQKLRYQMQSSDVVQWEEAAPPRGPISQGSHYSFFLSLLVGLLAGASLAYLVEYLDQSIKSPQEAEERLGLPILGVIPHVDGEQALLQEESRNLLEPYRTLRTNIRYARVGSEKFSLLVSSPIQGDGKTTKACNLGVSFAIEGKRVLIIDADLRRSSLHKVFGVPQEGGLSEYLTGQSTLAQSTKPTSHANLFVITAGTRPPNPTEILGGGRMGALMEEAFKEYDVVILDSPAVVPVSDALLLVPHVEAAVIIARSLKTPLRSLEMTKDSLVRAGANIIGIIFNGLDQRRGYHPYYSHYYHSDYRYEEDGGGVRQAPKNFREFVFFSLKEAGVEGRDYLRELWKKRKKLMVAAAIFTALIACGLFWRYFLANRWRDPAVPRDYQYQGPAVKP